MTPHHNIGDHAGEIGGALGSVIVYLNGHAFIHDELLLVFNTILVAIVGGCGGFAVQRFLKWLFPEKK
jgi:hypothetical protein